MKRLRFWPWTTGSSPVVTRVITQGSHVPDLILRASGASVSKDGPRMRDAGYRRAATVLKCGMAVNPERA